MQYELPCECGATVLVTEGSAGSRVACRCGRAVQVPSLKRLREMAGVPTHSPEFVIERLLLANELPQETACALCGAETTGASYCMADCAVRAMVERPRRWYELGNLAWFLVGAAPYDVRTEAAREHGRDLIFRLPLRVCGACMPRLSEKDTLLRAVRRTELYRQLLERFPEARVSLAAEYDL